MFYFENPQIISIEQHTHKRQIIIQVTQSDNIVLTNSETPTNEQ